MRIELTEEELHILKLGLFEAVFSFEMAAKIGYPGAPSLKEQLKARRWAKNKARAVRRVYRKIFPRRKK